MYDFHGFRLADFIVRRAFALLTSFKFSFVGYLQNLDNACFHCLIASLQSTMDYFSLGLSRSWEYIYQICQ